MLLLTTSLLFSSALGVTCATNHFKKEELIAVNCAGDSGTVPVTMDQSTTKVITHFPTGASNVRISISADKDLDLCLFDDVFNKCAHNQHHCVAGYRCNAIGAAGGTRPYEGMSINFSGDDTVADPTVTETITIDKTTRDMYLNVLAFQGLTGTVTYSYDGITPCPADLDDSDTCLPCGNYDGCAQGSHPVCNGGTTVTCATCTAGQVWNAQTQACETTQPSCIVGRFASAQVGVMSVGMFGGAEQPSDGCCAVDPIPATHGHFCQSTGDPHIHQFNGNTNHAYINGDYWLYNGQKLELAARHVNKGNVAGNNAFLIRGDLLDGNTLEFYDQDTSSNQDDRVDPIIKINGEVKLAEGAKTMYQVACDYFLTHNVVCDCQWKEGELRMTINDKTTFTVTRWNNALGWNNIYLNMDEADRNAETDTGMCTSDCESNSENFCGKPHNDPYPESRMDCRDDPFTIRDGKNSHNLAVTDYFCQPAAEMRRRRLLSQELTSCKSTNVALFTEAYIQCGACKPLGQDRIETCMLDACLMGDAEMALGEIQGCTHEIVMQTPPADRATVCPAGTDYNEHYQACEGSYDVTRNAKCSMAPTRTYTNKYLKDCHNACNQDTYCHSYDFDVGTQTCRTFSQPCTSMDTNAGVYFTVYTKAVSHVHAPILARGSSFNGGNGNAQGGSGPVGYGGSGHSGSSSTVPDLNQHTTAITGDIGDVKDSLSELRTLINSFSNSQHDLDELEDDLEDDFSDLHTAVQEIRTMLAQINTQNRGSTNTIQTGYNNPAYYGNTQPQYQPSNQPLNQPSTKSNDDWKTIGIVSAVMSFVLLGGAAIGVSVYFCCMRK